MKKRIACLLTALMVLSMGTTVLAAPSTGAEAPKVEASTSTGVKAEIGEVDESVKTEANTLAVEAAKAVNADAKADDVKVLAVVDIKLPEGTVIDPEKGIDITIKAEGVKAGDSIVLLHKKDGTTWETIIPSSVKDGEIVANFKSLSPVAIVKVEAPATSGNAPAGGTAPKAGVVTVLPFAALVCAAGAAGCARKMKF